MSNAQGTRQPEDFQQQMVLGQGDLAAIQLLTI